MLSFTFYCRRKETKSLSACVLVFDSALHPDSMASLSHVTVCTRFSVFILCSVALRRRRSAALALDGQTPSLLVCPLFLSAAAKVHSMQTEAVSHHWEQWEGRWRQPGKDQPNLTVEPLWYLSDINYFFKKNHNHTQVKMSSAFSISDDFMPSSSKNLLVRR